MEHIEQAGIHSGDSACVLPPMSVSKKIQEEISRQTRLLSKELGVVGLMNIQYALKNGEVFILEVNPRASRTVPFVSKAIGYPLAKLATKVMLGKSLKALGFVKEIEPKHISVKEAVFPFSRFPDVDTLLGPEMKSTGEVMGIGDNFGIAFAKAQAAAGYELPKSGTVFISVHDGDKQKVLPVARQFIELGFRLIATTGTADLLKDNGIPTDHVFKLKEGRPHVVDRIKSGQIQLVVNTTLGKKTTSDSYDIRRTTLIYNIPYATTISGAKAIAEAVSALQKGDWDVKTLQEYHRESLV
jgi:carbamoyl-phosphate synthase large subunit